MSQLDWMAAANCRGMDPELFFPEHGATNDVWAALAVCRACAVRSECLAYAMEVPKRWEAGIIGGTTPNMRRKLSKQRRASAG